MNNTEEYKEQSFLKYSHFPKEDDHQLKYDNSKTWRRSVTNIAKKKLTNKQLKAKAKSKAAKKARKLNRK